MTDPALSAANSDRRLHFSSTALAARDRLDVVREVLAREIMRFEIDPLPGHALEMDITIQRLPGASVASNFISAARNTHSAAMLDDDDPVLSIVASGACTWEQAGRVCTVRAGEAVLTTRGEPGTLQRHVASRVLNIRLDRAMFAAQARHFDDRLLLLIDRRSAPLRLLTAYAEMVRRRDVMAAPELGRSVTLHLHDLAALCLGTTDAAGRAAETGARRIAQCAALKADILAHLTLHRLSADWLASRHGISPRTVRALLADERTSLTHFVREQRLLHARRLLADPRQAGRTIGEIAYGSGFNDLSYFNRAFRQRFGMTPSDARTAAAEGR